MEFYQLRTFITVAEEKNLTRAAKRMNTSQPAVSAHIKALEEEVGLPLFNRTPKGMEMTRHGLALREDGIRILEAGSHFLNHAKELKNNLSGDLTIGLNSDSDFLRTQGFFAWMHPQYPGIKFKITQSNSGSILQEIKSETLDAGYFLGKNTVKELDFLHLQTFNIVIVAPSAWREEICHAQWADLARLPWIQNPPLCPFHDVLSQRLQILGLEPPFAVTADQEATIKSLVCGEVGLALLLEHHARKAEKKGELAIWEGETFSIDLNFGFLKSRRQDPVMKAVIQGVSQVWDLPG
ncbi:MAG: LysR family transcriptional regulator [Desulfobacterium sp.]|nr:LysR family transcriptional regulator [Desulfobacterium sp.]